MDESKNMIFKGGTSLSKCYSLIQRFSEDIDLVIDKSIFPEGKKIEGLSGKKFEKLLKITKEKAVDFIQNTFKAKLEESIRQALPNQEWKLSPSQKDGGNLEFFYPCIISTADNSYVKQFILIEMGVKGDIYPCEDKEVKSYAEAQFPELLKEKHTKIRTLLPIRTFWEKITLLHMENNRPKTKELGDRLSRHYYDVHRMIKAGISDMALKDMSLLNDVIINKKAYFRAAWAQYDKAQPGTLKIIPNEALMESLVVDYESMRQMIFGEVPEFSEIIQSIQRFEGLFNSQQKN